jgi:hypothetical protein
VIAYIRRVSLNMVRSRYWPFDARWAFFASLILVPSLVALAVWLYRPAGPLATTLTFPPLLLAVLLGLLPVALVILGGVTSVEAAGVRVAFVAVRDVVNTRGVITARSVIADNLGSPPGRVTDSDRASIFDSLKDAVGTYCVVADLKEGDDWWDTRLLVLVAGAVRLAFPKAVVFTSATPGQPGGFVGWATPSEVLRRLLAREPKLRDAYQAAHRDLLLQQLATPMELGGQAMLPWAARGKMQKYWPDADPLPPLAERKAGVKDTVEYPFPSAAPEGLPFVIPEDEFRTERVLLDQVVALEQPDAARSLTEVRVRDLFGSILHTDAVEREDDEGKWVETILTSTADFVAVTRGHQFENLVPRRAAVNAVLLAVVSGSDRTNGSEGERKT